jgi:hypothetical protein
MSTQAQNDARTTADRLDELSAAILDFENRTWREQSVKDEAIRNTFSLSPARYYQLLGALLESPLAVAYDPLLVNRIRRLHDRRLARRDARARRSL